MGAVALYIDIGTEPKVGLCTNIRELSSPKAIKTGV